MGGLSRRSRLCLMTVSVDRGFMGSGGIEGNVFEHKLATARIEVGTLLTAGRKSADDAARRTAEEMTGSCRGRKTQYKGDVEVRKEYLMVKCRRMFELDEVV